MWLRCGDFGTPGLEGRDMVSSYLAELNIIGLEFLGAFSTHGVKRQFLTWLEVRPTFETQPASRCNFCVWFCEGGALIWRE